MEPVGHRHPHCDITDLVDMIESAQRSLVKTLTYRILALLATIPVTGLIMAIEIHILLAIIYYIHERIWTRISWGR